MNEPRKAFGDIVLVEVFKEGGSRYAKLQCRCGALIKTSLSHWNNSPQERCRKCAIKKNRIFGTGLRRKL